MLNPEATIDRVYHSHEQQVEAETDEDGQRPLEGARGLAQIERVSDNIRERVTQFEEHEEHL